LKLSALLDESQLNGLDFEVTGVSSDSRLTKTGELFIALKPLNGSSNLPYIKEAIEKGACAILKGLDEDLKDLDSSLLNKVKIIAVENPRFVRSRIAGKLYPGVPESLVAVTGTNGKSSVASFCRQIWTQLKHTACFMGTTGLDCPENLKELLPEVKQTSVDAFVLHQALSDMHRHGVTHVSMEASSHGLDQYRMDGIRFKSAGFTNIERDHLDYHQTMERYFSAKKRLFSDLIAPNGVAVLNADVKEFKPLQELCRHHDVRYMSYGWQGQELRLLKIKPHANGQTIDLEAFGKTHQINLPLIAEFQAMNALCATGLVVGAGDSIEDVLPCLEKLKTVSGRMQKAGETPKKGIVYIDYAQNIDGMRTALKTIRPYTKRNLTVIFGCGGGRDLSRREGMGIAAREGADRVIITDDNPRYEDPQLIRTSLLKGCPDAIEIPNRSEAIRHALSTLEEGDICLIAGKGHEREEIVGDQRIPYNDFEEAQKILLAIGGTCS
jgi:UDP-N-acetylmuramoyl-L-alanyl-D-glutamate--2,6-diaminopimelate ligase